MNPKYVSFLAMKDNNRRSEKELLFCIPKNLLFVVCVVLKIIKKH